MKKDFRLLILMLTLLALMAIWLIPTPLSIINIERNLSHYLTLKTKTTAVYELIGIYREMYLMAIRRHVAQSITVIIFGAGFFWLANSKLPKNKSEE